MKLLMISGGLLGFLVGFAVSWSQENAWPSVLLSASATAYVSGLLLRWWGRVLAKNVLEAHHERLALQRAAEATPTSTSSKR